MMLTGCTNCGGCRPRTICECLECKNIPPISRVIGEPKRPPHRCQTPLAYNILTKKMHFWDHLAATPKWECVEACGTGGGGDGGGGTLPPCSMPAASPVTGQTFQVGVVPAWTFTVGPVTSAPTISGQPAGVTPVVSALVSGVATVSWTGSPSTSGQSYDLRVTAQNACSGGIATSITNSAVVGGTGTVAAASGGGGGGGGSQPCTTPAVVSGLTPATMQVGVAYSGTITFSNTTAATLAGLPAGLTAGTLAGNSLPVTGTPTTSGSYSVSANLTNACGTGTAAQASNVPAGSGSVSAAAVVYGGENFCGVPTPALAYTSGSPVGWFGFQESVTDPSVTQYVQSVQGFVELAGSENRKTILFLTASGQVTGYSIYQQGGLLTYCD
jgi:hypothetical protein